ncbi:ABC transporter permease [Anaerosporobacter faecicola]|uniref:ABC transporter permease n=1 Tax=Anaerosporobacter faecicola TaxID=2718714 RepID=UPI001EE4EC73|nr:ABC transporter permease subunit [Anaerosporobacter faecicola]
MSTDLCKINQKKNTKWQMKWKKIKQDRVLYLILLIPIIYLIVFKYVPMAGNILAFRKFKIGGSMFGERWVGWKYFNLFIKDSYFWQVFKNTFLLSVLNLLFGFPIPIILALLLNEVKNKAGKRVVQTLTYLPKFLSTVVVVSMLQTLLSPSTGAINSILQGLGFDSIYFLNESSWFRPVYIISDIWQFMGWNSILYLTALTSIDPQLYEAAAIDGAGRWKQTLHVTLPGIMPTIVITLILSTGSVLSVGFEKVLLLYTSNTMDVADVISTYTYRMGIVNSQYSYTTAVGLFQGVINLFIITAVNKISKKTTETSLW